MGLQNGSISQILKIGCGTTRNLVVYLRSVFANVCTEQGSSYMHSCQESCQVKVTLKTADEELKNNQRIKTINKNKSVVEIEE